MYVVDDVLVIGAVHEVAKGTICADGKHFQIGQLSRAYLYSRQASDALLQFGALLLTCHVQYEFSSVRSDQSMLHSQLHLFLIRYYRYPKTAKQSVTTLASSSDISSGSR